MQDTGLVPAYSWGELFHRVGDRDDYEERRNILPSTSRSNRDDVTTRHQYLERLVMGLAGGAALTIPMLVMVLRKDLLTSLLTTSVATMLFAGALALFGTRLKWETVLASVVAYAAWD